MLNFKNDIKYALILLCSTLNISPLNLVQYCDDMAWGGLEETDLFQGLGLSDQQRIANTIEAELTNTTIVAGGISVSPLGQKACN